MSRAARFRSSGSATSSSSRSTGGGRRRTPAWAASTGPSTNCCRCSRKGPHRRSTTSSWASAVAGGQTSGPIPAPRHSAPTPAEASRITRPSSPPPCSRTPSSTSAIAATSSSTRSSVRGRLLIAADKTGRLCRGVELDPLYVDVIVRRYQVATGNPAVLIETGEAFELLAARRSRDTPLVSSEIRRRRFGSFNP